MSSSLTPDTAFSSEHLHYTALDSTDDETATFVREKIFGDPHMHLHVTDTILKPEDNATADRYLKGMAQGIISVAIRLRPQHDTQPTKAGGSSDLSHSKSGRMIGFIFLSSLLSSHHRSGCLAMSIARDFQGRGYGTEAINWMLDAGFSRANLHSITLSVFSFNRALKLYERVGFKVDGRQRSVHWSDGKWHDSIMMSMLENEWRAIRGLQSADM